MCIFGQIYDVTKIYLTEYMWFFPPLQKLKARIIKEELLLHYSFDSIRGKVIIPNPAL